MGLSVEKMEKVAFILKTTAHPTRIAIVQLLAAHDSLSVTDISERLHVEQSLLSHHLSGMKLKGILSSSRERQKHLLLPENARSHRRDSVPGRVHVPVSGAAFFAAIHEQPFIISYVHSLAMLHYLGYFAAIFIGLSLGIMGGGGSILTVPVLVYLMGVSPVLSTAYSLFVVGSTSVVGASGYFRKGLVSLKTALVFLVPSLTGRVSGAQGAACRPFRTSCSRWAASFSPKTCWCWWPLPC